MEPKLIDVNELLRLLDKPEYSIGEILSAVASLDEVDPVHAAGACRCGECEHYGKSAMKCFKPVDDEHTFHDYAAPIWKPTDFCSHGERREQNA